MKSLQIRELNNGDSQQVVDVILYIQQIEFNVPITLEQQKDLLDIEGFYINTGGNFWGAFIDDDLVGTIACLDIGHQSAALRKMFVKKDFRGKEYAVALHLLNKLKAYCIQNDIKNIYLSTVHMLKAAHRFYEKNGFEKKNKEEFPSFFPFMFPDDTYYQLLNIQNVD